MYPAGDRVDHLPAWADIIAGSEAEAIGFCYHAPFLENPWLVYEDCDDEQDEEAEPIEYDLNTGTGHFEIYEKLLARAICEALRTNDDCLSAKFKARFENEGRMTVEDVIRLLRSSENEQVRALAECITS